VREATTFGANTRGRVRRLVTAAHEEVVALLRENRVRLDSLAKALLEHETPDQADAYAAAGIEPRTADSDGGYAVAAAHSAADAPAS